MYGFDHARLDILGHDLAGHDVVRQDFGQRSFVFEQAVQGCFRDFGKSFIGWCEHGERAFTFEGVHQASGLYSRDQGFEVARFDGGIHNVSSLGRECKTKA